MKKDKIIIKKPGYVAPGRCGIKHAVAHLLPKVDPAMLDSLDFNRLYAIHSEIVAYGLPPEAVAEMNIPSYRCGRNLSAAKESIRQFRLEYKKQVAENIRRKREKARIKELAGRERTRAAQMKAREKK